jgi:hypothetical protein
MAFSRVKLALSAALPGGEEAESFRWARVHSVGAAGAAAIDDDDGAASLNRAR